jgi:hypothetical protein
MRMPSLGGIRLVDGPENLASGAAFELERPAREDATALIDSWSVEVVSDQKLVVARGGRDIGYEEALTTGLLLAQQGLDLLSVQGKGDLSIRGFDDDHIAWWVEPKGLVIRVVSIAPMRIDVPPITAVVSNASGQQVPQAVPPPPSWHESFRYFRLSQTSDDLFDAYRNAYLALESVLSSIAPQKMNQAGDIAESEGGWFRRALEAANKLVPLSKFVPSGTNDPIQYLFNELFVEMRSAMSHAKSGRRVLLPRNAAERDDVTDSLERLVELYLGLAQVHLDTRRAGGFMFAAGFRLLTEESLAAMNFLASDDEAPFDPAGTVLNPSGGQLVPLPDEGPVDTTTSFLTKKLASAPANHLVSLGFVRKVGGSEPDGTPTMAAILPGRLMIGSALRFEAELGIRGTNLRQPRIRYSF